MPDADRADEFVHTPVDRYVHSSKATDEPSEDVSSHSHAENESIPDLSQIEASTRVCEKDQFVQSPGEQVLRFHDLRHSCATLLLAQGVHPRIVMDLLGHSQIGLTMNTYSHVIPAMQSEVADRMDEILAPIAVKIAVKEESQMVN